MNMILRIKYLAVHADNYQGGSGKSYISDTYLEVPSSMTLEQAFNLDYIKEEKFFRTENIKTVSIEIISPIKIDQKTA